MRFIQVVLLASLLLSQGLAQTEISSSLQLVVAAMRGGEYILAPGTYTLSDTLTINDNLVLVGAGKDETIISIQKAPVGIRVSEDIDLRLEGISFRYETNEPGDILHLEAGRFEIIGCDFQGAVFGVAEAGLKPYTYGSALYLSGQARGLVAESSFSWNQLAALELYDSSDLEFKNNVLNYNAIGLFAEDKNQLYLESNTFSNHLGNAMQLRGDVTATILSTVFDTNGSVDTVGENSFDAVRISGSAKVSFEDSIFRNAPRFSLSLSENASVNGKNNVFENNGGYYESIDFTFFAAVLLEDESTLTMTGDTLSNNPGGAIELLDSSKANLSGVSIQGNGSWASIYSVDSSELILRNSKVQNNEGYIYLNNSKGTFEGNDISNNADAGIFLDGAAEATLSANTIANNLDFGVIIQGSARVTLTENILSANRSGIVLFGKSYTTLQNNQIHSNQRSGLAFLEDSRGIARENTIRDNLWNGIVVGNNASARLEANTLQNNTLRGILYDEAGTGSATGNIISGSKVGIHLGGEETPALENNTFDNNEQDTYTGPRED